MHKCVMHVGPVAAALRELVRASIEPLYRKCCGVAVSARLKVIPGANVGKQMLEEDLKKPLSVSNPLAPRPAETIAEFRSTVMPMLLALGPHSAGDVTLLYRVLRIIKHSFSIVSSLSSSNVNLTFSEDIVIFYQGKVEYL